MNGWILCPGDGVLIISPGEEYHGLFAKVDAFPSTQGDWSTYVQIDGRPSSSGCKLVPNAHLRWMGPGLDLLDKMRPTRPGQRVRVVLDNEALATDEMKALDGQLGEVTELGPVSGNNVSMITVKFDDADLLPASIYNYDLLIVPTPVVQYVPEPFDNHTEPNIIEGFAEQHTPPTTAAAGLRVVPLASIVVTTNTRKVFDETALAELTESVRAHGILQPIVLRPHATEAGQYELVAGGRRYRAAQLAGLAEVPATVRNLTDREFLEVQLLENLQRVDVRPADEAQAFAELLKNGFALEEIAAKVGKPARFVAERARLMELLPEWVEALQQGRLLIGSAQQLARLTRAQQADAHRHLDSSYGDKVEVAGVMRRLYSAADIRQHIAHEFKTHDLEKAAFPKDDATLYPVAGACLTCPKRTGNTPYLFDEMGGNTCLDGGCFTEKSARYVARMAEQLGAEGQPVLKVADHWGRVPADVLNLNKFKNAEGLRDNEITELRAQGRVRPALMTEGARAGQIVEVVLDAAVASQPDVVAAIKQEKAKQTQREKDDAAKVRALGAARRQAYYQLTTDVRGAGEHTAVVLRRMLLSDLQYGRHKAAREMLQQVYGWSEVSGRTYMDNDERAQVIGYLAEMNTPALQSLLLDLQLITWLHEEHPSNLPALCKELGWSDEQLLAAHAERKKDKKEATA